MSDVLELERTTGITAALDLYIGKILKDPSLGAQDDKGFLMRGNRIFSDRFSDNAFNPENRFYYGALLYINGSYADSLETLEPMKGSAGAYSEKLRQLCPLLKSGKRPKTSALCLPKKPKRSAGSLKNWPA